jgi:hypothetical protein
MKDIIFYVLVAQTIVYASALSISEVMSNPVGDDGGREWIEVYNATENPIDLSSLTISVKGGSFVSVMPLSGGVVILPLQYAIISSTVSSISKFGQDYPGYNGPLFKSSISLVNTGVTSLELKLQGLSTDILTSYVAAKEGATYSKINGSFVTGAPSPGEENKVLVAVSSGEETATSTTSNVQVTLPQAALPASDIIFYLPFEKTVVAGAPSLFSVYTLSHTGKQIDAMKYTWSFGDGGEKSGSSTLYRYYYPGRYVVQVEGTNGNVAGTALMSVRVVAPDIEISDIGTGKYGAYIDLTNPNAYDLDISYWRFLINGDMFPLPKNTLLRTGVTRFSGAAMGFASTTLTSNTVVKLVFPSLEEVTSFQSKGIQEVSGTLSEKKLDKSERKTLLQPQEKKQVTYKKSQSFEKGSSSEMIHSQKNPPKKDTRLASLIKSFFGR